MVVELFHLAAGILYHSREREVLFRVIIVHTEVCSQSHSLITLVMAVDELQRYAAAPPVVEVVAVKAVNHQVLRVKSACGRTHLVVPLNGAVAQEAQTRAPCRMFGGAHAVTRARKVA